MAIKVTDKMIHAAMVQAVEDGIIPKGAPAGDYIKYWHIVEKMIRKALEKEGQEF